MNMDLSNVFKVLANGTLYFGSLCFRLDIFPRLAPQAQDKSGASIHDGDLVFAKAFWAGEYKMREE